MVFFDFFRGSRNDQAVAIPPPATNGDLGTNKNTSYFLKIFYNLPRIIQ